MARGLADGFTTGGTMTSHRLRSASLFAALALVGLGACGGGSEGVEAATDDTPSTEADAANAATGNTGGTVAASGGSAPDTTAAPTGRGSKDPCRLLTSAEAEAALGKAVGPPVRLERTFETGDVSDCGYSALDEVSGPASIHAGTLGDEFPRAEWEQAERAEGYEEVSGIGDIAFYNENGHEIDVFDGGTWIQVQMINSKRFAEEKAILIEVARNAAARI